MYTVTSAELYAIVFQALKHCHVFKTLLVINVTARTSGCRRSNYFKLMTSQHVPIVNVPNVEMYQPVSSVSGHSCLCSSARGDPAVPQTQTYGPCSFAVSGQTSWSSLPRSFHDAVLTLGQFQCRLKTSLFRLAYGRDLTAHS